jgi:transposase InsO family protein
MEHKKLILHMQVLAAIDVAPHEKIIDRIRHAAQRTYEDAEGGTHQFKFRTVSTWYYRFKSQGVTSMQSKNRSDKGKRRKVNEEKLAEAIHEVLPLIRRNKVKKILTSTVYRMILEKGFFQQTTLSESTFRRIVREKELLNEETNKKYRLAFAMMHANEMWQVDTMVGPHVYDAVQKKKRKTYFIAFIDDASRLITHGEFYFNDNEENLALAFQTALEKRGKPEIIYCDNGSNYSAKGIQLACIRLGIKLTHAPIRDGAAKGKIERFFRTFRDQFLTIHHDFSSISDLNDLTHNWVENEYNDRHHRAIAMRPIDRFCLDRDRIIYLPNEDFIDEIFFVEENRKVNKDNTFRFQNELYECPAHLRQKTIQIRFHSKKKDTVLVYYNDSRMGQARVVNLHFNAKTFSKNEEGKIQREKEAKTKPTTTKENHND